MSFEHLRVYQAAETLSLRVNALTDRMGGQWQDEIKNLRDAAASVPYNIAEAKGVDRPGHGKMILHLEIARGSVDETRSALRKLTADGLFSEKKTIPLMVLARTIAKMLTSLIKKLRDDASDAA